MTSDDLPIYQIREPLRQAMAAGSRLILKAPTGAGKSTQVPQFLLDDAGLRGRILVLQPRRLAARMLAERVAAERDGEPGGEVGYQTRLETAMSDATRLCYITEGILQRMFLGSRTLAGISAVVFDEFHERNLASDLGLALVMQLQKTARPDLKIIVMSATLVTEKLKAYMGDCAVLAVESRQHPIDISYLARPLNTQVWEAAANALRELFATGASGDVLIFMPGAYEIRRTIEECGGVRGPQRFVALPLYGDLPPAQQREVMQPLPHRKVIVATNIAETSLTIPGMRHVIDGGLARVHRYDPVRGFNMLVLEPISRSSADQRAGRAGREGPGTCRRLWTLAEYQRRPSEIDPEVRRVDLAEAVLLLLSLGCADPATFPWLEPPAPQAVTSACALLAAIGAVDRQRGRLTRLGADLAQLPVHPRLGLLMLLAERNRCFADAAVMAAILSERPLVLSAGPKSTLRKNVVNTLGGQGKDDELCSDLFALMNALREAQATNFAPDFCNTLGISGVAARQVLATAGFFLETGRRCGLGKGQSGAHPDALLKAVLAAFPDRLARRRDFGSLVCDLPNGQRGELARESTVRESRLLVAGEVRELAGKGQAAKTLLSLASAVKEEWLRELFPAEWVEQDETMWDERNQQVVRRRRVSCLGLILEESVAPPTDANAAAAILAQKVIAGDLKLEGWDDDVEAWIERVRWVADCCPDRRLITYDETDIRVVYEELCKGATQYRDVRKKPCLDAVRHVLSWDDQQFVEKMAPGQISLPGGRRVRLSYKPGQAPRGRARVQDLYDLRVNPKVAGGRHTVLLEIQAPNMRTVQVTDDIGRFWTEHYPGVKKEFSRKYPKHEWR